jgi:cold shock CspA family protein
MRIDGTLSKWNDDRGFGFITPRQGGPEVFVHVSAFPKHGGRPAIGQQVTFEIEVTSAGKKQATNVLYPDRPASHPGRETLKRREGERPGFLGRIIWLVAFVALASYGYGAYKDYSRRSSAQALVDVESNEPTTIRKTPDRERPQPYAAAVESPSTTAAESFRCDGRTHCSQMTSCAEAKFFLRNCPGVKMDGDNDGIPCEEQWCKNPFSR